MAKWIRRLSSEQEIAGSSPARIDFLKELFYSFFFAFFLHFHLASRVQIKATLLSSPNEGGGIRDLQLQYLGHRELHRDEFQLNPGI